MAVVELSGFPNRTDWSIEAVLTELHVPCPLAYLSSTLTPDCAIRQTAISPTRASSSPYCATRVLYSIDLEAVAKLVKQRLETRPANQGASQRHKGLMNMSVTFVANFESSKRMEPGNRTFYWPTCFAQPTTVRSADFCEHRRDASIAQALTMEFGTVTPVALYDFRLVQWASSLASDVRDGFDQRIELGNVVTIRAGQDDRERDALRVNDEVVFAAELAPVRGIRTGFFPPGRLELMNCRRAHARGRFRHDDAVRPAASRGRVARRRRAATGPAVASNPKHGTGNLQQSGMFYSPGSHFRKGSDETSETIFKQTGTRRIFTLALSWPNYFSTAST